LLTYKSGIYKHNPNSKFLYKHIVRIVGFYDDLSTRYWIIANSWGDKWG